MVNKVPWLSSFRFHVSEKQGEKLEALLKEKLAISEKKGWTKIAWTNKIVKDFYKMFTVHATFVTKC